MQSMDFTEARRGIPGTRMLSAAVVTVLFAAMLAMASPAWAATFAVTNTNDSGAGSLRQAINDANGSPGADTISFSIPGDGPHTITPTPTALPTITGAVTIDGYTQGDSTADTADDASPNTLATGNDAVLKIVLNGNSSANVGLNISANDTTVKAW